jgi:hypothetical protein
MAITEPASRSPCCIVAEERSAMTRTRKASQADKTQQSAPAIPSLSRVSVRMYRQGLGDCFLITLPKRDGQPWRMLIDCGVILGTKDTGSRLQEVVRSLAEDTGGRVDVAVVTHEHYDHVAAFAGPPKLFCGDHETREDGQLQVGEVWFAWTEDPSDPQGRKLNQARADQVNRLAAMVAGLQSSNRQMTPATGDMAAGMAGLIGFFGLEPDDFAQARDHLARQGMAAAGGAANGANGQARHPGATARAMENARALGGANGKRVRYCDPAVAPWASADLPGIRIYVLGPPRDETLLKKTFASNEVYQLAASEAANTAFFGAAGLNGVGAETAADDVWFPFDTTYCRELCEPSANETARMPEATAEFLQRHYYGPASDMGEQDQSWRRIDEDWLGSAAQYALNLDSATNNTSLVLAIELSPGGEVLLFPADAQVGNWLSWQHVQWTLEGNKTVSATDLLKRTVFYKVGHHGSHNATLREHGLELMPHGLAALLPVDQEMARAKHWNGMPLPGLIEALHAHGGTVARMDEDLPKDQRFLASGKQGKFFAGPLYYEWRLEN